MFRHKHETMLPCAVCVNLHRLIPVVTWLLLLVFMITKHRLFHYSNKCISQHFQTLPTPPLQDDTAEDVAHRYAGPRLLLIASRCQGWRPSCHLHHRLPIRFLLINTWSVLQNKEPESALCSVSRLQSISDAELSPLQYGGTGAL
jgi:hypothetical protein